MKTFNGKAIYQPKSKAAEYSKWACNLFVGCSGKCNYCYNRTGITAKVLGGDKPTLKKCLVNEETALGIFMKEADQNLAELRKHGLFFNFVSDPFLPETYRLNLKAMAYCQLKLIPIKALTKQTWWVEKVVSKEVYFPTEDIAIGFTLTGHSELEPGCATNEDRIRAMKVLNDEGFKTWASIEPIIDFESSWRMIEQTLGFCDLYKVGLKSGGKYNVKDAQWFMTKVLIACSCNHTKAYIKDSLINLCGIDRMALAVNHASYVDQDYNIFTAEN